MGFFQDLKEDLSMAVNELLPEVDKELENPEKMAENESKMKPEEIKSEAIKPEPVILKEEPKPETDHKETAISDEEAFLAAVARLDENADIFAPGLQAEEISMPEKEPDEQEGKTEIETEEVEEINLFGGNALEERNADIEEEAEVFDLLLASEPEEKTEEPETEATEAETTVEAETGGPETVDEVGAETEEAETTVEEAEEINLLLASEPEEKTEEPEAEVAAEIEEAETVVESVAETEEAETVDEVKAEAEEAETVDEVKAETEEAETVDEVKAEAEEAEAVAEEAETAAEAAEEEKAEEINLLGEMEPEEMVPAIGNALENDIEERVEEEMEDDFMKEIEKTDEETQLEEGVGKVMTQQNETGLTGEVMDETGVITAGMKVTGDISSQGSMDILGTVIGNVEILGKLNISGSVEGNSMAEEIFADSAKITGEVHAKGSVKVGQSSVIIGNIYATSAVVAGAVKGDIDVQGPVILDTSAIVMGNIKSKSVQINNGAVIEGMCSQCYADVNPSSFFKDLVK